eukprot:CAMPEP_0117514890 /NCGR_PEP_ID=MMETSP0784-20121206/30299_1 /TAXON_ID=39447 /ORGANISM="" /LENGTH=932 /DNA_ID=CAMNT_0005310693 /DNA_START=28 /DNA_END=2826 /DNA_ORIENTATION=+
MAASLALSALCLILPFQAAAAPTGVGHALIQKKLSRHRSSMAPDAANALAQLEETRVLAHAVASGQLTLDNVTRQSLLGMWDAMERIIVNTTMQWHDEDQFELTSSVATVGECAQTMAEAFGSLEGGVDAKATEMSSRRVLHTECRLTERALATGTGSDCSALTSYKSLLSPPDDLELDPANPLPYITALLAWAQEANHTYVTARDLCEAENAQYPSQRQTCNSRQTSFEESFCDYRSALKSSCTAYSTCRSRTVGSHSRTVANVRQSEEARKVEYTAAKAVQCYIAILNSTTPPEQAELDACEGIAVDTTHLNITYPEVPQEALCDMTPVATRPCDEAWTFAEYANKNWSSDAPATRCSPCTAVPQVASGESHALYLAESGAVHTRGTNSYGELGSAGIEGKTSFGVSTYEVMSGAVAVAAGLHHSLVLLKDGSAYSFGFNQHGQLGLGDTANRDQPTQVFNEGVIQVAAGRDASFFLMADGRLFGCGKQEYGQLGLGNVDDQHSPVLLISGNVRLLAAGEFHTLVVLDNNTIWGAGFPRFGALAIGEVSYDLYPAWVNSRWQPSLFRPDVQVKAVVAGVGTAVLLANGSLYGGGDGVATGWGEGQPTFKLMRDGVRQVALGRTHTLIVTEQGELMGRGNNRDNQLGYRNFRGGNHLQAGEEMHNFYKLYNPVAVQRIVGTGAMAHRTMILGIDGAVYGMGKNDPGRPMGLEPSRNTNHNGVLTMAGYLAEAESAAPGWNYTTERSEACLNASRAIPASLTRQFAIAVDVKLPMAPSAWPAGTSQQHFDILSLTREDGENSYGEPLYGNLLRLRLIDAGLLHLLWTAPGQTEEAGTAVVQQAGTTIVADDAWHRLLVAYDGESLQAYIDGAPELTVLTPATQFVVHELWYGCGGRMAPNAGIWAGSLRALSVADHALAPEVGAPAAANVSS